MKNGIGNIINLMVKEDIFLIIIGISILLIIGIIVFLIKLEIDDKEYYKSVRQNKDLDEEDTYIKTENEKEQKEQIEYKPLEEDIKTVKYEQTENKKLEDIIDEELQINKFEKPETEEIEVKPKIEQEKFDFTKLGNENENNIEIKNEQKLNVKDTIKDYENEQEELAIISASELEERLNNLKNEGLMQQHEEEIAKYEEEQESKAVISYEELLKRAKDGNISYESKENIGGIRISKVDTNKIETYSEDNDKPYYKEEAFLEALKEFRQAL